MKVTILTNYIEPNNFSHEEKTSPNFIAAKDPLTNLNRFH